MHAGRDLRGRKPERETKTVTMLKYGVIIGVLLAHGVIIMNAESAYKWIKAKIEHEDVSDDFVKSDKPLLQITIPYSETKQVLKEPSPQPEYLDKNSKSVCISWDEHEC